MIKFTVYDNDGVLVKERNYWSLIRKLAEERTRLEFSNVTELLLIAMTKDFQVWQNTLFTKQI